jgi:DNA-directed RNA polymerase subunit RPC12/RpoP
MERRLLCTKCSAIFDISIPDDIKDIKITCPDCGTDKVTDAPPWAPLGSGANIVIGDEWAYECQECKYQFRMAIPKSPEEDKSRKCPKCNSGHLHLITGSKTLPLYCG